MLRCAIRAVSVLWQEVTSRCLCKHFEVASVCFNQVATVEDRKNTPTHPFAILTPVKFDPMTVADDQVKLQPYVPSLDFDSERDVREAR